MTNITSRDALIARMTELIDAMPAPFRSHLDNFADDFRASTSDYLAALDRFDIAIDYSRANDDLTRFYADYDASIAALNLTDADLALILYYNLRDHDCESDCDLD